ncbi:MULTISPECIES: sensor histidine kinase [Streptomycetaceae]|uniref:histidine kinase n=1 Tax=Streptantibioticus cattleyicolor (strain ATCC 35852 / DSM 46488 / JCM 4925 / NBRC 14057 / NRRL 8057) TaxID=1003195 RepID=F8K0I3_STREN|nr:MULTISPECIES: HAMP domain-containing sensor histidine kinase [Streptomycetaceae]AEW97385.1 periplasmic sensor signal transduction histidine kinase [Streptantibioticus cattleyicolor NRRL 8057 = DSM 46488]MYS61833.1 HAMP domain-containing protein [Streptomyces sp. SID5468]CCB77711.1 Sensor protein [Streptantibioticus cattleyicolor NRRL 8057 = DSM 46488]
MRRRLALITSATVALVLLGACAAAFAVIRYELTHQLDLQLTQQAHLVRQEGVRQPRVLHGDCDWLAAPACAQVVPADPAQDGATRFVLPVGPQARDVAAGRHGDRLTDITVAGHPARMLTTPAGPGRALQVAVRSDAAHDAIRQAGEVMAVVGGVGVLLAGALGYAAARTGLAPVARLTATAERIAATRDARHRIELPPGPPHRQDEVTRLAASFNTMLGELEQSVAAQRRLVADASHELRTPLTALRTNAELLARPDRLTPAQRDRASGALQRQLREVTQLVGDLVELARDEEPQPLLEHLRPAALAEECVRAARDHHPGTAFELRVAPGAAGAVVRGVPARLARLLGNLLDNAAKFSPPGGPVEVALTRAPDGDAFEVTVRDHGPGIAPEDLPHIFDRFYRASAARALPGSGLGLAMAQQIARAHDAVLTAAPADGGGACFRLTLPVTGDDGDAPS